MTDKTEAMDNLIAQDADLIDVSSGVTEADREVLIRISNSDDETAQRIRRGLIYTWEVGEIARHRQQATEAQAAEIERLRKEINRTHDKAYWAGVEDGKRAALEQSK
jgi:L-arabinose isomerase